jgi:hypothetical protein
VRPLRSVFRRCVLRLSVSGNTVLRVQLPRPLAADDDLPAPSSIADPSPKTNCLTSGRLVCYKVVWSRPGAQHGVTTRGQRSPSGGWGDAAARGEKRGLFFLSVFGSRPATGDGFDGTELRPQPAGQASSGIQRIDAGQGPRFSGRRRCVSAHICAGNGAENRKADVPETVHQSMVLRQGRRQMNANQPAMIMVRHRQTRKKMRPPSSPRCGIRTVDGGEHETEDHEST